MRFSSRLIPGTLIQRYKRFLADVRLNNGDIVTAHCTNTGSMMGCKEPGSAVYISRSNRAHRKLRYTWEMIRVGRTWVGVNTFLPNQLVVEAVECGIISELKGYAFVRREVITRRGTRLDLRFDKGAHSCFVEVKNVTAAIGTAAAFPDAVSLRGTKHLKELMRLRRTGYRAAVVFVVQRRDCTFFRPADEIDAEYGRWLRRAIDAGVEILPYSARVTPKEIVLVESLETRLRPERFVDSTNRSNR